MSAYRFWPFTDVLREIWWPVTHKVGKTTAAYADFTDRAYGGSGGSHAEAQRRRVRLLCVGCSGTPATTVLL